MTTMQRNKVLAQINVARAIAPLDDQKMHGFVSQLDEINRLAENAPGFIWRLQTEFGDATDIQAFDDPQMIVNMSVWDSMQSLKSYVYSGEHLAAVKRRAEWFHRIRTPHLALWWISEGHVPSINEGLEALTNIARFGSTQKAFTFAKPYKPN